MCASSSTTRTLKLKPAIPSIHHHPVIRMWCGHDGNVNELGLGFGSGLGAGLHLPATRGGRDPLAGPGWGSTPFLSGSQHELQWVAHEAEAPSHRLFEVSPIGKVEQADVVDEHHHRRRL